MNEPIACSDTSLSAANAAAPGERLTKDETPVVDTDHRLVAWLDQGHYMLGRIVPALLEERNAFRTRIIDSDRRVEELERHSAMLQQQLCELREEHQRLQLGQTAIVQGINKCLGQMTGILEPMKDLEEKIERARTLETENAQLRHDPPGLAA